MNAIQAISLKLQMGIHPSTQIQPELLRAMWCRRSRERSDALQARAAMRGYTEMKKGPRRTCAPYNR